MEEEEEEEGRWSYSKLLLDAHVSFPPACAARSLEEADPPNSFPRGLFTRTLWPDVKPVARERPSVGPHASFFRSRLGPTGSGLRGQ